MYYLREHIINFLTKAWGTPNRLLKAVLEDATNNVYIAGVTLLLRVFLRSNTSLLILALVLAW